jgi:TolB-like protein
VRQSLVAYLSLFLSLPLSAQEKTKPQSAKPKTSVAVMDFEARAGISKDEAASLSDAFTAELTKSAEFTVVDRNRLKQILQEQGFQQSEACSQTECIVQAGKILKTQKMFAGVIGRVGKTYQVNIQLIDVETSEISTTSERKHSGEIDELLTDVIPEMAQELILKITGKEIKRVSNGKGFSWWWYLGGVAVLGGGAALYLLRATPGETPATATDLPKPPGLP